MAVSDGYGVTGAGGGVVDNYQVGVVDNYGGGGGLVSDGYGVVSDSYGGGISQTTAVGYSPPNNFVDTQSYYQPDSYGNPVGENLNLIKIATRK